MNASLDSASALVRVVACAASFRLLSSVSDSAASVLASASVSG